MAESTVGALKVKLSLNSAEYEAGLKRAKSNVIDFRRGVQSAMGEAQASLTGMAASAGSAGTALQAMGVVGVGLAVGLGALTVALGKTREALSFADEIGDTANKIAVSTDALQEYRYAVHQLGGDYKDADKALEGFSVAFGAAQLGLSKKATKPFEALGLDPNSFKNTEDALQAVIDKISHLGSTAEQAALADKLGLTGMLPAIRAGVGKMDELRAAAERVGFVMDSSLIEKAGEANDKIEDLQHIVDTQLKSAFVDLAPVLTDVLGLAASIARQIGDMVDGLRSVENRRTDTLRREMDTLIRQNLGAGMLLTDSGSVNTVRQANDKRIAEIQAELAKRTAETGAAAAKAGPIIHALATAHEHAAKAAKTHSDAERQNHAEIERLVEGLSKAQAALEALNDKVDERDPGAKIIDKASIEAADAAAVGATTLATAILGAGAAAAAAARDQEYLNKHLKGFKEAADDFPAILEPVKGISVEIPKLADRFVHLDDVMGDVDSSVNALKGSLKSGDWASAANNVVRAIQSVQRASSITGPNGQQMGTAGQIAAGAQLVGGLIGGKAGGALAGAGSGAATGFAIGGLPGAAIGAVLGGIAGFLGASKAEKQAKAQAAAEAAAQAAQHAQDVLNQKRTLEVQLLQLQGKSEEALALQRQYELEGIDESNRALAQQAYDAQDAAQKQAALDAQAAAAADLLNRQRNLEVELLDAQGKATEALALQRQLELEAMDPALRGLQQQVYDAQDAAAANQALADAQAQQAQAATEAAKAAQEAAQAMAEATTQALTDAVTAAQAKVDTARQGIADAYDREAASLGDFKSRFQSLAAGIGQALDSLTAAQNGSLPALASQFNRVAALARLGNEQALGDIAGLGPQYAKAITDNATSSEDAARGIAKVRAELIAAQDVASRQVSIADQQLEALREQVIGFGVLHEDLLTVAQAIAAFGAAQAGVAGATFGSTATALGGTWDGSTLSVGGQSFNLAGVPDWVVKGVQMVAPSGAGGVSEYLRQSGYAGLQATMEAGFATIARNTGDTASILTGATTDGALVLNVATAA